MDHRDERATSKLSALPPVSLVIAALVGAALADGLFAVLAICLLSPSGLIAPTSLAETLHEDQIVRVYRQASPGVVSIIDLSRSGEITPSRIVGSGFVVDLDGHILTNHHVVDGLGDPGVVLSDRSVWSADLVGDDPAHDLALLKIEVSPERIHPLRLGDSGTVQVGQRVVAIGSPFGLEQTLTAGNVSFVGRRVPLAGVAAIDEAIQIDAAFNPGNSGSPLLDTSGAVVGVNTAAEFRQIGKYEYASTGVSFAIPSSAASRLLAEMISGSLRVRPWLGVTAEDYQSAPSTQATALESTARIRGAMLVDVVPGSPADDAQLQGTRYIGGKKSLDHLAQEGDVVLAIDGVRVESADDLASSMARAGRQVGDPVTIRIVRDGLVVDVLVRLHARSGERAEPAGAI